MKLQNKIKYFKLVIVTIIAVLFFNNYCFAENEPEIGSESAILIEANSGKILYKKNSDEKRFPASLTKILTAIIVIENCNLDDKVTVNYNALSTIPSGYTIAELQPGEEISVENLLDVLLVHSANDAANVLAMHVGGSIDSFISMMNSKAKEIGCKNSNFTNTYGLQDENHYTTATDLALIAKYCMKNNDFRSFVSQPSTDIPATNKHDARTYTNTNDLLLKNSRYYYENTIGIKTGYTKEAKNCLIAANKKGSIELISVVLGAENYKVSDKNKSTDTIALFNYAYSNFSIKKLANKDDVIGSINIFNGTKNTRQLEVLASEDLDCFLRNDYKLDNLNPKIKINDDVKAPLASGSTVGTATYEIDGVKYTVSLIASHDVEKSDLLFFVIRIILVILILISICGILYTSKKTKCKKIFRF